MPKQSDCTHVCILTKTVETLLSVGSRRKVDESDVSSEGIFVHETETYNFAKLSELSAHKITCHFFVQVGDIKVSKLDCLLLEYCGRTKHSHT